MATKQKDWKSEWEKEAAKARKLAKRANQRLLRLERYSKNKGYSEITKYAYAKAEQHIRNFLNKTNGKPRFKERVRLNEDITDGSKKLEGNALYKANVFSIRQRIKALEEFLSSESSTIGESRTGPKTKGVKAIYEKRAKTITDEYLKYGLTLSDNDLKRFFESKKQAKLEKIVGSKQMFIDAAMIKKLDIKGSRAEIEEFVKTHIDLTDDKELDMKKSESRSKYLERMRKHLNYTDDPVLNDLITNALKEGINAKNIFI